MSVFFLTGTDTDIGKTVVTTLLASFFKEHGLQFFPYKPIQSGAIEQDGKLIAPDPDMYRLVMGNQNEEDFNTYLLKKPSSPHLAAELEGVHFDFSLINEKINSLRDTYDGVIVEGAGGLYVPIKKDGYSMIDWIENLKVPTILVARAGLGTINHTVLSIEAMQKREIPIAGLILNHVYDEDETIEKDNVQMIQKLTNVPIIGTVPYCENIREVLIDKDKRKELHANWNMNILKEAVVNEPATII
ncbi:dethiobiotin synthetase [Oikeobacillus pervagus]|uniref:ATP-dependent dethiobiotin synthetase BioD n=1 Tax=Oikeobacillus pervagus TaxID=1325931 RepID=A0AAJ1T7U8_9BACI|nr:dethiobiotin synthase [Oikeobacillus pervagus]MDQ0216741.1 dethiobiotin synthetase [Oikeobacillus pervagus]